MPSSASGHALAHVRFAKRTVWSLAEAREALERLIGAVDRLGRLDEYLIAYVVEPSLAPTVLASSFASTLEMVREGLMEMHQQGAFRAALRAQARSRRRRTETGRPIERRGGAARR